MHRQPSHLLALEHACLRPRRVIVVNIKIKFKRSICTHTHSRVTYIYSRLVRKAQFMFVHRTSCVASLNYSTIIIRRCHQEVSHLVPFLCSRRRVLVRMVNTSHGSRSFKRRKAQAQTKDIGRPINDNTTQ